MKTHPSLPELPRTRSMRSLSALFMAATAALMLGSSGLQPADDAVTITVTPARTSAAPGEWIPVAVIMDIKRKWHINTNDPKVPPGSGDPGDVIPTAIQVASGTGGLRADIQKIQWPQSHTVEVTYWGPPAPLEVYEDRAIAYLPVQIQPDAAPGLGSLSITVSYQACNDEICLQPATTTHTIQIASDHASAGGGIDWYPELFNELKSTTLPPSEHVERAKAVEEAAAGGLFLIGGLVGGVLVILLIVTLLMVRR